MPSRTRIATALTGVGLGVGLVVAATGIAGAGHDGALTRGIFSGRAEVATDARNQRIVGDPDGRGSAYVFSPGGDTVCYVLEVDKIAPATMAHIHEAKAGSNGGVVVNLSPPTNGTSAGCVDTGNQDLAADITLRRSAHFYVNVHNEEYPGGAVRAQLGN